MYVFVAGGGTGIECQSSSFAWSVSTLHMPTVRLSTFNRVISMPAANFPDRLAVATQPLAINPVRRYAINSFRRASLIPAAKGMSAETSDCT